MPVTPYCYRRLARAMTCSATTCTAPRYSKRPCARWRCGSPEMVYARMRASPTLQTPAAEFDRTVAWLAILLLGLGMVMVYSASIAVAEAARATGHQPTYYLLRHALFLAISAVAAIIAFQIPISVWQRIAPY